MAIFKQTIKSKNKFDVAVNDCWTQFKHHHISCWPLKRTPSRKQFIIHSRFLDVIQMLSDKNYGNFCPFADDDIPNANGFLFGQHGNPFVFFSFSPGKGVFAILFFFLVVGFGRPICLRRAAKWMKRVRFSDENQFAWMTLVCCNLTPLPSSGHLPSKIRPRKNICLRPLNSRADALIEYTRMLIKNNSYPFDIDNLIRKTIENN